MNFISPVLLNSNTNCVTVLFGGGAGGSWTNNDGCVSFCAALASWATHGVAATEERRLPACGSSAFLTNGFLPSTTSLGSARTCVVFKSVQTPQAWQVFSLHGAVSLTAIAFFHSFTSHQLANPTLTTSHGCGEPTSRSSPARFCRDTPSFSAASCHFFNCSLSSQASNVQPFLQAC